MIAGVSLRPEWIVWGVGAGVVLVVLNRIASGRLAAEAAQSVTRVPFDVFRGTAEGIFGLPDPAAPAARTECEKALESGDDWRASFYCPATSWAKGLFDGK